MSDHEPWDNERLDAAWTARSARAATPSDLPRAVMTQLRSPKRRSMPTWRVLLPIAAAIAVAVVLVRPSPLATPVASSPSTIEPTASQTLTTPSTSTFAGSLPIVTVAELLDRSGYDPSGEEVIVRAWVAITAPVLRCRANLDPHPLIPWCGGGIAILVDGPGSVPYPPESRIDAIEAVLGGDAHVGVHVVPTQTVEAIVVGHFRDHRWTTCPTERQPTCKARFVIDRLLPIDAIADAPLEPWSIVDGEPDPVMQRTPTEVIARVEAAVGPARVLSIGYLSPGSQIRDIEPKILPAGLEPGLADILWKTTPLWIVRALTDESGGSLRTFVVFDVQPPEPGSSGISEITETNVIALDDVIHTLVIDLWRIQGQVSTEPDKVTINDRSGLVVAVRRPDEATAAAISREASRDGGSRTLWLRDPALPGSLYLAWEGGMCDQTTITIYPEAATLKIDRAPTQPCPLAAVSRIIRVDFSDPAVPERLATSTLPPISTLPPSAAP